MTDIKTVGDLRNALARYPADAPVRAMTPGQMNGVRAVRDICGRVTLVTNMPSVKQASSVRRVR